MKLLNTSRAMYWLSSDFKGQLHLSIWKIFKKKELSQFLTADKRPADSARMQAFCRKFAISFFPSLCFCLHNALWKMSGASGSIKCTSLKPSVSQDPMNGLKELPFPIRNGARDILTVFKSQAPSQRPTLATVAQNKGICNVRHPCGILFSRMLFAIWRCSWRTFRILKKNHKKCYKQTRLFRDSEVTFPQQWPFRITTETCQGNLAKSYF